MPRPSHSRFGDPKITGWAVQIFKLHSPVTSSLLDPNTPLSTLFSNTLSLRSSLNVRDQVSHPHKTTGKIVFLYSLLKMFMDMQTRFNPHTVIVSRWSSPTLTVSAPFNNRMINHLTPNGHYMGRTAQLTSRCCISYIYSTNVLTEYFKHAA